VGTSEYYDNLNLGNTSIKLKNTNDLYFEKTVSSDLANVQMSYQNGVFIEKLSSKNLFFKTLTLIDKVTGLKNVSLEIDGITGNFKIMNSIMNTSIEFKGGDIIFDGNLIIDLDNPYQIDLNGSNLLDLNFDHTRLKVNSEIFIYNQ
jgi:hypothetical protein